MQTQFLRKMDFLTRKMQWRVNKGFQKHKSSGSHMETVARYVAAPATIICDIGHLLFEGHACNRKEKE